MRIKKNNLIDFFGPMIFKILLAVCFFNLTIYSCDNIFASVVAPVFALLYRE